MLRATMTWTMADVRGKKKRKVAAFLRVTPGKERQGPERLVAVVKRLRRYSTNIERNRGATAATFLQSSPQ